MGNFDQYRDELEKKAEELLKAGKTKEEVKRILVQYLMDLHREQVLSISELEDLLRRFKSKILEVGSLSGLGFNLRKR